jgi:hypothetical protein
MLVETGLYNRKSTQPQSSIFILNILHLTLRGTIERKFQALYGKTRSMLNACHLPIHLRQQLWAHTAHLATRLDTT